MNKTILQGQETILTMNRTKQKELKTDIYFTQYNFYYLGFFFAYLYIPCLPNLSILTITFPHNTKTSHCMTGKTHNRRRQRVRCCSLIKVCFYRYVFYIFLREPFKII